MMSITQPSTPSILSPPPNYDDLSNNPDSNSINQSVNPYFPILPRPSPLIRRVTSPDLLLSNSTRSSIKPHHQLVSFFSRVSSALKTPTLPRLNSHRPKKLQKPRPKNQHQSSNKNKNLNHQPIVLQPWFTDSDSDFDNDSDEEGNNGDLSVQVENKAPIRTIVKRTPVHFFTGDSTVLEIQTFWSDGTQVISKPQIGSHDILRRPEDWMGWPSRQRY